MLKIEINGGLSSVKKKSMCLRPHGRSENFIKARFIIRNTTVLFYIHTLVTFTTYVVIIVHKLLW